MKAIYGLYTDPEAAQLAVDTLRKDGVPGSLITVITSQPYEEFEFSHRYKQTWLFWIAAGGGALGLLSGLGVALITEKSWPLVTGGMPIVAWWPNIIIMFELTMLGAILATVVSLFVTTGLPTRESRVYDPAVADGKILVAIEKPREQDLSRLESTLRDCGVEEVKTVL